jgi:hypothetical protein
MYTLREIPAGYPVRNESLGDAYTTVLKETNPKEFVETCKAFWNEENPGHTYGFVVCKEGSKIIPLMEGCYYYVMTENGRTFDNLSLK